VQKFYHLLHVGDLVREELYYGLVASHFAKLAHYQEKGFDLGGNIICLCRDSLFDVDLEESHDWRDE